MSHARRGQSRTSRVILAPRERLYRAFIDPAALQQWQAPDGMTATVHEIDAREGGGYRMTLTYPPATGGAPGKSTAREDTYSARFLELDPPARIVEAIVFDTVDRSFAGEMIMTVTLAEVGAGTEVTIAFDRIPPGIRPEDNDAGTGSSLAKLARFVEEHHAGQNVFAPRTGSITE